MEPFTPCPISKFMNDNDTICKNCGYERKFHIIPKENCPGDDTHTYHEDSFFEPMQTYTTTRRAVQELNTPTTAPESSESLDDIITKILIQLDTINAQIETINSQLKTIQ
jgi:hypothetical protein